VLELGSNKGNISNKLCQYSNSYTCVEVLDFSKKYNSKINLINLPLKDAIKKLKKYDLILCIAV